MILFWWLVRAMVWVRLSVELVRVRVSLWLGFMIRVMLVLGLQLVSSRFGIILCQLLYGLLYYVLVI